MALAWHPVDLRNDEPERFNLDPGKIADLQSFLDAILHRPAWHADAACRGRGTATWFPGRGEATEPAKATCEGCLVRAECLAAALDRSGHDDGGGVWGGTSERQRRKMRSSPHISILSANRPPPK